jgi:hypothetical protein
LVDPARDRREARAWLGAMPFQVVGVVDDCTESQPRAVVWTASTGMEDLGYIGGGKAEAVMWQLRSP